MDQRHSVDVRHRQLAERLRQGHARDYEAAEDRIDDQQGAPVEPVERPARDKPPDYNRRGGAKGEQAQRLARTGLVRYVPDQRQAGHGVAGGRDGEAAPEGEKTAVRQEDKVSRHSVPAADALDARSTGPPIRCMVAEWFWPSGGAGDVLT